MASNDLGLIDTHTHLESFSHSGALPEVLNRAFDAGVDAMITIGTSPEDWELYRNLAKLYPGKVRYSVGLHPCAVESNWRAAIDQVEGYWSIGGGMGDAERPVALGEIGLDRFHLPKDDLAGAERIFDWQRQAFAEGLGVAKRLGCPIVVHSRGAFAECVEMIDGSGVDWAKVVFHCFTEGEAEIAQLNDRGGWASFTGIITYKTAENVRAAAKAQGLERMMIETDAPYLTPMPHRGKRNEPAFLRHTAAFCARDVFGVSDEEFAAISTANARSFFGI